MLNINILIIIIFISIFINYMVFKYGTRLVKDSKKNQIQNIHSEAVPRLGGLVIFSIYVLICFFYLKDLKFFFLISFIPILPAIIEDFNYEINPITRLICMLIGSFLIVNSIDQLPKFEFLYSNLFNNHIFQLFFFTLALTSVTNGQNIIDGTNGLSALTSLSIFGSILYIGLLLDDLLLINSSLLIISLLASFLIFNYPYGKIFLGDSGSYFLGFFAGYLIIYLFGKYPELPTWSALVILYYPCMEVIFSYFRKIISRKSPFKPDNLHLHLKIYYLLSYQRKKSKLYNALVAPFLSILWLSPLAILPFSIKNPNLSIISVIFLIFSYIFLYLAIPTFKNND